MSPETESPNADRLTSNQHAEAVALAQGGIDRNEDFSRLHPGKDSEFNGTKYERTLREDGTVELETLEVADPNVGYLKITHRQHYDDTRLEGRYADSYSIVADLGSSARGFMFISNGKVLAADYIDNQDVPKSVRNNPERGYEMASYTIAAVKEELLAEPTAK